MSLDTEREFVLPIDAVREITATPTGDGMTVCIAVVDPCGAGKFRYRVRARNASGASAYAGPAIVTVTEK